MSHGLISRLVIFLRTEEVYCTLISICSSCFFSILYHTQTARVLILIHETLTKNMCLILTDCLTCFISYAKCYVYLSGQIVGTHVRFAFTVDCSPRSSVRMPPSPNSPHTFLSTSSARIKSTLIKPDRKCYKCARINMHADLVTSQSSHRTPRHAENSFQFSDSVRTRLCTQHNT